MHVSPEVTAIIAVCATNVGALIWNAASNHVRLKAVERALNNGISDAVVQHGQQLTAIETRCHERHEQEVS